LLRDRLLTITVIIPWTNTIASPLTAEPKCGYSLCVAIQKFHAHDRVEVTRFAGQKGWL
jgi:hypothetical protein